MKVLVSGGAGFIGSHVSTVLSSCGMEVIIPYRNRVNTVLRENSAITLEKGSLLDRDFIEKLFEKFRPDAVIHLAWQGILGESRETPEQLDNLIVMQSLLEMTAKYHCKTFLGLGSQAEYGVQNCKLHENDRTCPSSLYGIYKLAAGYLGLNLAKKYGYRYAWLRLFSTYGPGDSSYYVLPYAMECFLQERVPQLTQCTQLWDYLYVKDIARILYAIIISKNDYADIYNLCSGNPIVLREAICLAHNVIQPVVEPGFGALPMRSDGLYRLEGSNDKLLKKFGNIELTSLQKGIGETVEWMKLYVN